MKQNRKTESPPEPLSKEANPVIWISFWKNRENLFFLAAILLISFMVYLPSLQNGFVNWDDHAFVYENPHINFISSYRDIFKNAKEIFTTDVLGGYTPLVTFSFAFEKILYGLESPGWWHLTNIILHLTCVLLVFRIALALGLELVPAAFCALLFGIHPMRVESVAWISERRDVLYGVFYLLALYYYIKSVQLSFQKRYFFIILTCFILSLLSKIQAVSLPLSMLLIDYYFGRKLSLKLIYEKWFYFLLSFVIGLVGLFFLKDSPVSKYNADYPFGERIFLASYTYVLYLIKSFLPYKMVPFNPFPEKITWMFYASTAFVLPALGATYYFFKKNNRIFVFGLLFFTFNTIYVFQLRIGGQTFLADRYTYIAYMGLFFIYSYGLQFLLEKHKKFSKVIYVFLFIILGVLGYLNFEQNKIWENGETLWSYVIEHYPGVENPWRYKARYYKNEGRLTEAIQNYSKAIEIKKNNPKAYNSRGLAYFDSNYPDRLRLALQDFTKALQFSTETKPKVEYLTNRGIVYTDLNMYENALQDFNAAQSLEPTDLNVYYNKSYIYIKLEQYHRAQPEIEKYVELNPENAFMWSNLGSVSRKNKQYIISLKAYNRAIQINPSNTAYYYERLITYYEMGEIQKARKDLIFLKSKGFQNINPEYERMLNQGK
jgi:tetratricopeptide (TPR) repeat protein